MKDITDKELYALAEEARKSSHCPYSGISVGAALLCESGEIYTGCNIENSAFSPSICAERVAVFKAVSSGEKSFRAIAVAGGKAGKDSDVPFPPCGACRQVMREFCKNDFRIILKGNTVYTLSELLPHSFGEEFL